MEYPESWSVSSDSVQVLAEHLNNPEGNLVPLAPFQEHVANLPQSPFRPQGESTDSEAEMLPANVVAVRQQVQALKEENRQQNAEIRFLKNDVIELNNRIQRNRIAIQEISDIILTLHRRLIDIENAVCELQTRQNSRQPQV